MKYIIEDETLKAIVERVCTAIERVTETTHKSETNRDEIAATRGTIAELLRNLPEVGKVLNVIDKDKEDKEDKEDEEDKKDEAKKDEDKEY